MRRGLALSGSGLLILTSVLFGLLLAPRAKAQRLVVATAVIQEGDIPMGGDGSAVTTLDNPYTLPSGRIGLVGQLASGDHFVWVDGTVIWLGADAPVGTTLTISTSYTDTMGFTSTGGFVYNPLIDGEVGIWTDRGLLARETEFAPGFGPLDTHNFIYDPYMTATGLVYWVSSVQFDGTSTTTDARALYISTDGTPATTMALLKTGDIVTDAAGMGFPIETSSTGIDTDVAFSSDGSHYIVVVDLDTPATTTNDGGVVVDGALVLQEGSPAGVGVDLHSFFDRVSINNAGNYLVSGDTNGSTTSDEFIAYNGTIMVQEGDTLGGLTLPSASSVYAMSINNLGAVVHHWYLGSVAAGEALFYSPDATTMGTSSVPILRTGDDVDLDGDRIADATITDFNSSSTAGSGLNLADDGNVVIWVDLDYDGDGTGETEAVISFIPAYCGDGIVQGAEECDEGGGESATCDVDCSRPSCGDGVLNVTAGEQCDEAGRETADCDLDCTAVFCGDGTHNATAGEECDGGGESVDCDADCTVAECGDFTVNPSAGEDCDVGGELTAFCDPNCTSSICGDGFQNALAGEFCDEAGETAECDLDCSPVYCGDGRVNMTAGEVCDEGGEGVECDYDCTAVECGDGILNVTAGEECDSLEETATCNSDCTLARCGDSVVNTAAGEECDTGGQSATCDLDCTVPVCGDGILNRDAGEACEDGNDVDGDGCDSDCTLSSPPICGDGVTDIDAGEECDTGGERSELCDMDCTIPICGDGVLNTAAGEECEDGNMQSGDGCSDTCMFESNQGLAGGACGCSAVGAQSATGRGAGLLALGLLGLLGLSLRTRRRRSR